MNYKKRLMRLLRQWRFSIALLVAQFRPALALRITGTPMVAEGVYTARSVHARAQRMGVEMPITAEVYRVLYEGKPPREAVTALMVRPTKVERA